MDSNMRSQSNGIDEPNLPMGFKFIPTDVELMEYYLLRKLKGEKLPSDIIIDLDGVYSYDPHQLPLNQFKHAKENQGHFFTEDLKKSDDQLILNTTNGSWRLYKDNVPIRRSNDETIGFKTKFRYHDSDGNETDWKMIEYRCHPSFIPTGTSNMKRYIVCHVKQKKEEEEEGLVEELPEEEHDSFYGTEKDSSENKL